MCSVQRYLTGKVSCRATLKPVLTFCACMCVLEAWEGCTDYCFAHFQILIFLFIQSTFWKHTDANILKQKDRHLKGEKPKIIVISISKLVWKQSRTKCDSSCPIWALFGGSAQAERSGSHSLSWREKHSRLLTDSPITRKIF